MAVRLDHTIVYSADKEASSAFLVDLFGLSPPVRWGPFVAVQVANGVTLDFFDGEGAGSSQHYAFMVGEEEFDQIFGRIRARGLDFWADPGHRLAGEINTHDGGRGVYFDDPSGHSLEIITRPYGDPR